MANVRTEILLRVFRGDPALDGEPVTWDVFLSGQGKFRIGQRIALRDEDLRTHNVRVGDFFGHCVLDLNTRVHLDEEPLIRVDIDEELDGPCVVIADAFDEVDGRMA